MTQWKNSKSQASIKISKSDRFNPEKDLDGVDFEKIDQTVLALLYFNLDKTTHRAWKSFDWDVMERLYEKGWISDPKNKNKSVLLTEEGIALANVIFRKLFSSGKGSSNP